MQASHDHTTTRTWSARSSLTPNLREGEPEQKREEIRRYFHETFDVYERLFLPMQGQEAFLRRADPLRHPLIFYYGHTAVFFINKLVLGKFLPQRIDPQLESMCAIGVDEMSWDDLNEKNYTWPDYHEVKAYRDKARAAIDELIRTAPLTLPIQWGSPFWVILMGIEHERIHLETSSVLIRQLPLELLENEHAEWPVCTQDNAVVPNALLPVKGGTVTLGKRLDHPLYGWDNEYGHLEETVSDFEAARYLVSNGEYREFVDAGGYAEQRFWTEEGWKWACYDGRGMPRFWRKGDGGYSLRLMLKEVAMPWSWPVEVNQLEAKAFCNWKAEQTGSPVRLPTEAEWYQLLDASATPDVLDWPDGNAPGNINLAHFASSMPVDTFAFGGGFYDVLGNVWQHTETPIAGFPGFKVHPLYDDFSTPTFDCRHNLIKGGSWVSTGNEATRHSRYAFRRHFYQHAGFRYIASPDKVEIRDDRYETDPDVVPLCQLHYGSTKANAPAGGDYPQQIARSVLAQVAKHGGATLHALELGCGVGRTSFELANTFSKVTGIDPTARTIRIGVEMVDKGYTQWQIPAEGEIVDFEQVYLKDLGLADALRSKVSFMQADLANMKPVYQGYDLILINGLLEKSYNPAAFLKGVHERLNDCGLLVIACSNHWNTAHTAREHWLGGFKDRTGENRTTLEGIRETLGNRFGLLEVAADLPQALRIDARAYDYRLMQISVWQKR